MTRLTQNATITIMSAIMLFLLLPACALLLPRGVQEIVPTNEDGLGGWALSPNGDKLIYHSRSSNTPAVLDLKTNKKQILESKYCGAWTWLDNQTILCWGKPKFNVPPALISDRDVLLTEIKRVTINDIDLSAILDKAEQVFLIEMAFARDKRHILILSPDYLESADNYLIVNLTNAEELLRNIPYTVISRPYVSGLQNDKMYSSDGAYYYVLTDNVSLSIYNARNDELLRTVPLKSYENVKVGGWVFDNSGIIYQINQVGPLGETSPIYKLNVP